MENVKLHFKYKKNIYVCVFVCLCVILIFKLCGGVEGVKTLNLRFKVLTAVTVQCRKGEQMVPECLVPTVKYGGGRVIVWRCFAGDSVGEFIKIGVQLTNMSTTAIAMQ